MLPLLVRLVRKIASSPLDEVKSNIQAEEMKALNTLRNRIDDFSFTFSDKKNNLVIICCDAEQSMTATHVHKSTYERACLFVQIFNTHTLTYTGANRSTWPSSLSFIPTLLTGEKVWGDWDTQEGISEMLKLRLEYYLTEILSFPLPPDILADFLSWLPPHVKTPKRNISRERALYDDNLLLLPQLTSAFIYIQTDDQKIVCAASLAPDGRQDTFGHGYCHDSHRGGQHTTQDAGAGVRHSEREGNRKYTHPK